MSRLVVVASLSLILAFIPAQASAQACDGSAGLGDTGGGADAWCDYDGGDPGTGSSHEILWSRYCETNFGETWLWEPGFTVWFVLDTVIEEPEALAQMGLAPDEPVGLFTAHCQYGPGEGDSLFWDPIIWPITTPPTPEELRDRARAQIFPPDPVFDLSPGLDSAVVGLDTWLWVTTDWDPIAAVEVDGGVVVEVQALPTQTSWTFADTPTLTCAGPGVPWTAGTSSTYCAHRFESSSATQPGQVFASSVAITWEFRWWLNGVDQGVFGAIDTTASFDLPVGEIQAIES